jgi:hypothetical protein
MLAFDSGGMTSSSVPSDFDGSSTESNDADRLEQAQPLAGESASATAPRIGAPAAASELDSEDPTTDEIEQRQEP